MYLSHVLDSVIFSYFWNSYFSSYGEFKIREIKLRMQSCRRRGASRERHTRSVAIGRRGVIIMWGVTAGKASHNTSNASAVTAGKMGRNSSSSNPVGSLQHQLP